MSAVTGHIPDGLSIMFGDCHIYDNHIKQVREQLDYADEGDRFAESQQVFVTYNVPEDLKNIKASNWRLFGYNAGPKRSGEVAK